MCFVSFSDEPVLGADLIKAADDAVRAAEVHDEVLGFGHVLLPQAQQFFIPLGVMEAISTANEELAPAVSRIPLGAPRTEHDFLAAATS
ncbi:hypothetical protein [Comamonas testosteroni]|uniref:hypothetical protein n=1 Tax=Comamonas testosteroni TaxID=285 RepID=UPI0028ED1104|nr:hypothetical protein [Comamonas testosteroni]